MKLPAAAATGVSAPLLVALFTSTSAVSVTGLIIVDTPTYWSPFGQGVIMVLFQIGGFGLMAAATLLGLLVLRRLRLGTRLIAQAETRSLAAGDLAGVLKLIALVTIAVELSVTVALALRLHFGYGEPWGQALWNGLFHAVSAFNNAGFSTYTDSLMRFVVDPFVLVPIGTAIVIGGLGFPVLHELRRAPAAPARWSIHTKVTLLGTTILLIAGTIGIAAYEWNNPATLGAHDGGGRIAGAIFHSVTARTAGFNTLDVGAMHAETWLLNCVLMFIGGGSASTAGGIKVVTFFLLGFMVWAEVRGERDSTVFRRRVSLDVQRQALAVVLLGVGLVGISTLSLMSMTDHGLSEILFESVSAFATVGLSTGLTGDLPPAGQMILVVLMFVGRTGTITVAVALALRSKRVDFRYPEERPIVG